MQHIHTYVQMIISNLSAGASSYAYMYIYIYIYICADVLTRAQSPHMSDASKFKECFEKIQKGDFSGMEVIKQDAEDAVKVCALAALTPALFSSVRMSVCGLRGL